MVCPTPTFVVPQRSAPIIATPRQYITPAQPQPVAETHYRAKFTVEAAQIQGGNTATFRVSRKDGKIVVVQERTFDLISEKGEQLKFEIRIPIAKLEKGVMTYRASMTEKGKIRVEELAPQPMSFSLTSNL